MTAPSGWRAVTLGEVAGKPQYGFTSAARTHADGLPLLRTTDITRGPISWSAVPRCTVDPPDAARYLLKTDDIVVSRAGSVGVSALISQPPPAIFASYLMRLRATDAILPRFLALFLQSPAYWSQISQVTNGIALPNINGTKLAAVRMLLPPIDEQWRIVDILEEHLSRVDAARSLLDRSKRRLSLLRSAVCESVGGGGLSPLGVEDRRSDGDKIDGRMRDGWDLCPIQEVSLLVTDGDHNPPRRVPAGIPHLTAKAVKRGRLNLAGCSYVDEAGYRQTSFRYTPSADDVIVTCVGTIGQVAVVPRNLTFSADRNLAAIRLNLDRMLPHYLEIVLNSTTNQRALKGASSSTAQPHLYLRDLRSLSVLVPPIAEQERLIAWAYGMFEILDRMENVVDKAALRERWLYRSLLDSAFAGQLHTRVGV